MTFEIISGFYVRHIFANLNQLLHLNVNLCITFSSFVKPFFKLEFI